MNRVGPTRLARAPRLKGAARIAVVAAMLVAGTRTAPAQDVCAGTAPVPGAVLSSFPVVTSLTGRPLLVTAPPGDLDRLFIVEQTGLIRIHHRGVPPAFTSVFLDITDRVQAAPALNEMGLLGLAFDPDYATTGSFYVNYTEGTIGGPWFTVVSRFSRSAVDPDLAEPDSEERLLTFQQPETNHNGGQLLFGPDGFLYVATGDGGGGGDAHGVCGNGQNRATLLGKMLRIDVRDLDPLSRVPDCGGALAGYRIPSTNPFALTQTTDCGEIWTWGLRNPWRSAFDAATGDLYVADVGQNCWEEVNVLPNGTAAGANLGWRSMEGLHCFAPGPVNCNPAPVACPGVPSCNDPSLRLPVVEYGHALGCSITGGEVYRGCQMPDWRGTYFYGDFCTGFVKSFRMVGGVLQEAADRTALVDPGATLLNSLTSFGTDAQGEIYIVDRDGVVRRVGPRFVDLEVSAPGDGAPLMVEPTGMTWGDLARSSMRPVDHYRVYRGTPNGAFRCRFAGAALLWPGADPDTPPPGQYFAYVVTAVAATGEETRPGIAATGFALDACP